MQLFWERMIAVCTYTVTGDESKVKLKQGALALSSIPSTIAVDGIQAMKQLLSRICLLPTVLTCIIHLSFFSSIASETWTSPRVVQYDNFLPWQQSHVIPVIHNLESFQVPSIIDALDGIRCCSVSLRHASALSSLTALAEQFGPYCEVGVSTVVSTNQVDTTVCSSITNDRLLRHLQPFEHLCHFQIPKTQIAEAEVNGALFVSTMFNSKALIMQSKKLELPILCGVSTLDEARQALLWGANALKFYPATEIKPRALQDILEELRSDGTLAKSNVTDIIVAGSVLEADFSPYIAAGATNFAMGFDCKKMTPIQIRTKLKDFNKLLQQTKRER